METRNNASGAARIESGSAMTDANKGCSSFIGFILVILLGWGIWTWVRSAPQAEALRLKQEFRIARDHGATNSDLCIRATGVANAYLSMQDERNYTEWNAIAKNYCEMR